MPSEPARIALAIVVLVLLVVPSLALAPPPGRIVVYSTPTGALACIDNKDCDTTGATFTVEGNTWHKVVVTEIGYLEWTENVYVTSDQTSMVTAYLDLDPDATGIRVSVTPGGGTVCLDNSQCQVNATGRTMITLFKGVSPGFHTISVESPSGYADTMELVQVTLGKITDVSIGLEPSVIPATTATTATPATPATGTIRVYVDRTGSTICIDNVDCFVNVGGSPGPGTGTSVFNEVTADQTHLITVAAEGYKPVSAKVSVGKDQLATVDVTLQPLTAETILPTLPPSPPPMESAPLPQPTRAGLGALPVLGALALCGAGVLFRKGGV